MLAELSRYSTRKIVALVSVDADDCIEHFLPANDGSSS